MAHDRRFALTIALPLALALALACGCATPAARRLGASGSGSARPGRPKDASVLPEHATRGATQPSGCNEFRQTVQACSRRAGHPELAGLLYGIARCEVGGSCDAGRDSPGHRYRGAFQFLPRTWERQCLPAFARQGLAECMSADSIHDACCATVCATDIIATRGTRDWPACGREARRSLARRGQIRKRRAS